jgi:hypothetical protein
MKQEPIAKFELNLYPGDEALVAFVKARAVWGHKANDVLRDLLYAGLARDEVFDDIVMLAEKINWLARKNIALRNTSSAVEKVEAWLDEFGKNLMVRLPEDED